MYKATADLVRSFAEIADEIEAAGYSEGDVARIKQRVRHFVDIRDVIRRNSDEVLDLKPFEADMRHLIDTYIEADEPRRISAFDGMSLLDLTAKIGIRNAIDSQLGGMKGNRDAIAETIENNVRKKIIKECLSDPIYYETMSALLDEIIAARKSKAIEYEDYLNRVAEIARRVDVGHSDDTPAKLDTVAKRALWNNLGRDEDLALKVDAAVREKRPDEWRGNTSRERTVKGALYGMLQDEAEVERIFLIIKAQSEY